MRAELPGQLVDALLVEQLRSHFPGWHAVFDALGIVRVDSAAAAPGRLPYLRQVFDRAKLLEYICAAGSYTARLMRNVHFLVSAQ